MITDKRNQVRYKLILGKGDVTADVLSVDVDIQENLLTTLDFTLAKGMLYLDAIQIGSKVVLQAGTFENGNYREMFSGNVKYIRPNFKGGLTTVTFTCYSSGSTNKKGMDRIYYYPSTQSERTWANVDSIKVSDLIRNIVREMGMTFGTFNNAEALIIPTEIEFTKIKPIKQYISDWAFLGQLAQKLKCRMWEEIDPQDGKYRFYFIDQEIVVDSVSDFAFVYIERDSVNSLETLGAKDIQLMEFSCDEDSDAAIGNLRVVSIFDSNGQEKSVWFENDEVTGKKYYYELDEEKMKQLTPEEQDNLRDIIESSQFQYEGIDFYYKKIEYIEPRGTKDWLTVEGRPTIGVKASITFSGNVNITAHRHYRILGVSNRYSSKNGRKTWYMKSLKHIFGSTGQGYICKAELYRY